VNAQRVAVRCIVWLDVRVSATFFFHRGGTTLENMIQTAIRGSFT
jgi:hypothetical protein